MAIQSLKITPRTEPHSAAFLETREHLRAAVAAAQHVACPRFQAEFRSKLKRIIRELQDKGI